MVDILQALMWVTVVCLALLSLLALLDRIFYRPLPKGAASDAEKIKDKQVTVLIPARNEEHNIAGCVESVLAQSHKHVNVIVVNDQSTDRTGQILKDLCARDQRVLAIDGENLPDGWVGKGWALYQGHKRATGEWIVLLDADVRLEPWAIEQVVSFAEQRQIDFLNPYPYFVNLTFWERLMQPLLWGIVRIRFPLIGVNQTLTRANPAFAMAFGPMIVVRKSAYDAVDGHRHVAMDILEDVALAKLMRKRGYRTYVINGKNVFRVRMYENLKQLMDGWSKTAFGAMGYNLPLMLLAIFSLFWAAGQPFVTLVYGWLTGTELWLRLGLFQVMGVLLRRLLDHHENSFPVWTILLHPLAIAVVLYIQSRAVWQYYFGAYNWKDRAYKKPKPADTQV